MENLRAFLFQLRDLLRFEFFTFNDAPITLGQLAAAVLLMLLGVRISRFLSSRISKRVSGHFGVGPGEAEAVKMLLFYALVVLCTLVALHVVHVPLTIFTLFGGAIAIGVGFGSQNLINNFISGLILLFERPVRVGDLIQVDAVQGSVIKIGPRSTRLRTADNLEIIIPNSQLLEKAVSNSTLGDSRARFSISVGVAYGSDVRQVEDLLYRACTEVEGVLGVPEPLVSFADFGDSALQFKLFYFVDLAGRARIEIESELRFAIERLFREAKIEVPFPQRAVSISSQNPLAIQVVK